MIIDATSEADRARIDERLDRPSRTRLKALLHMDDLTTAEEAELGRLHAWHDTSASDDVRRSGKLTSYGPCLQRITVPPRRCANPTTIPASLEGLHPVLMIGGRVVDSHHKGVIGKLLAAAHQEVSVHEGFCAQLQRRRGCERLIEAGDSPARCARKWKDALHS
jgi:hypothetical protein